MSDMEMTTTNTALANETEADKLARLATEINTIKAQTLAVVQNATLEIGKRLIQAKGAVGHGNWSHWLKDNVDYSERTAQNIISIYERFGNGQQKLFGANADPEQVAKLNRSQMLALMSIKDEEQCFEFMSEHKEDLQDMSKRELEAAIRELNAVKAREEQNHNFAKLKQEQLDKANAELDDLKAKYQHDMDELQKQLNRAGDNTELSALKDKLAEMEKYQTLYNDAQAAAMESQTKLEKEIAELKQENEAIKNAPVEAAVVEKVPEETVKEMEALKAKIAELEKAKPETSEAEKKFAHHFENIRAELQASVEWLGKIDEDKAEKYRTIFKKMLTTTVQAV
ncbi:MAG: DUF3102 domain-containing protein [Anaerovibrio sp.]|uniref:DUF3102 domain-containing protein n=1 Tax=Anaerovibrio sp. TaxID=1872532 RepID=UPI0025D156E7|nr:DUF3102 domain-containing protein [Anaerovibrio sp.]MCR5175796.1 DUF3102 domain-containing protein [Anaerovibrio sp.]